MNKPEPSRVRDARHSFDLTGAAPLGNSLAPLAKPLRVKVFKSGNSLAVRMPKALGLEAGMELLTEVLPDGAIVLRKAEAAPKKLDISGFWGKAPGIKLAPSRDFDERPSTIAAREAARKAAGDV
jgi:antitoxin VapB